MSQKLTALVTGGTDGIGKEIARQLARLNVRVLIVGSGEEKGRNAEAELRQSSSNDAVYFIRADLSLMQNTNRLVKEVTTRIPKLHYLVLCAGIVRGRRTVTSEGLETNFAVDYLTRFALTKGLLPMMYATGVPGGAARIVVISGAARNGVIRYDDVSLNQSFTILRVISQFCEANDVFIIELSRRLARSKPKPSVTINALKVGVVRTNIRRQFPLWMKIVVPIIFDPLLGQKPEKIADSAIHLLMAPQYESHSGGLFSHIMRFKPVTSGRKTSTAAEGQRLWNLSEELLAKACNPNHQHKTA